MLVNYSNTETLQRGTFFSSIEVKYEEWIKKEYGENRSLRVETM